MSQDDDELLDDEEEILVYVEFDGSVASNTLSNEKLQFDMIGLDREHPIMQVNGKFYEGTYHNAVGTYMFFEPDENPHVDDPAFDVTPSLKYVAKTRKVLKMNRIFVELKTDLLGDSSTPECLPTMEAIKKAGIPPRYQDETLESWKTIREDRMKALNDYLEKQRVREEKRSLGIEPDSASDDDNPFAIYKPPAKHKKSKQPEDRENIATNGQIQAASMQRIHDETAKIAGGPIDDLFEDSMGGNALGIADDVIAGPSTSKNSKPWSSPSSDRLELSNSDSEDFYRINIPNFKSLHRTTIQVPIRTKVRKFGKVGKKKMKKGVPSGPARNKERHPEKTEKNSCQDVPNTRLNEVSEGNDEEPKNTLESMASLTINNSTEELDGIVECEVLEYSDKTESAIDKKKEEKQRRRDEKMLFLSNKLKKAADERRLQNQRPEDSA